MIMAIIAIDVDIAAKLLFGLRSKMLNGVLEWVISLRL